MRSPKIDLDSLYGRGPNSAESAELYDPRNPAQLKIGTTQLVSKLRVPFENDLPRDVKSSRALIGDERNDENLGAAQIHVAFIKFHNYVVGLLQKNKCPKEDLLKFARIHVVRHFQWIILDDLLKRLLDADVLATVIKKRAWYFTKRTKHEVFMPLEFSAATYRFGHSMIRHNYEWNSYHSSDVAGGVPAELHQLLEQTAFSGRIGKTPKLWALESDWVIDWRRFFDFSSSNHDFPEDYILPKSSINRAAKIDRVFNLHLEAIPYFQHNGLQGDKRLITVRNLLRGFALRLPSGELVAKRLNEPVLTREELLSGAYENVKQVLSRPEFKDNTPLWYYIIKEAELKHGERLGPVGSRIVAETIVGLINRSHYSIFRNSRLPKFARVLPEPSDANFQMVDLLHLADVVNPIGKPRPVEGS
ncbi:MAG TPA: peroxidase family protein [Pyrinomonadaceae bacterium]|nr:peroxidase family protein [Pyrinomonadaceae bacterium]